MSHDLAILGGGPAGVGAAYRAARRGLDVVLLEREPVVGGAAASVEVGGMRVDHGSHRLHRTIGSEILTDLQRLLGSDLQRRERRGRIRLGGRWLAFPLRPTDLAISLPSAMTARILADLAASPFRQPQEDTFAEQVRAQLGPTMLERFYGPYAEKLWGLAPDDIDGEQFRRRVSAGSATSLLRRVLRGGGEASHFYYPRRGFGQISEAFSEAARSHGADLRLSSEVRGLSREDGNIRIRTSDAELVARTVLSTLPFAVLPRLWEDAPPRVRDHAAALESRAMTLVYLVLDTPRYTRFDAHYFPERSTPVTRISEPKNYRDAPEDPSESTVLCAEIPCARDDGTWDADPDALRGWVVDALVAADLPHPPIRDVVVRRLPSAYPIYRRGYAEHTEVLEGWVATQPGLVTLGRQGLFVHDNSHHALAMAYDAVAALAADGTFDTAAWADARQRFRHHVVED